jgi:hypothetical protein
MKFRIVEATKKAKFTGTELPIICSKFVLVPKNLNVFGKV